jgi:hypothetical protein
MSTKTIAALARRNRAAAKVRKLEDDLYRAHVELGKADTAVNDAQRIENTRVRISREEDWELA